MENYTEKILQALHSLGFNTVSLEEVGHTFTYEGIRCLYLADANDPQFLRIAVPYVFDVTDDNRYLVLESIHTVNQRLKYVKLYITDENKVWIFYEHYLTGTEDMEMLAEHIVRSLHAAHYLFHRVVDGEETADGPGGGTDTADSTAEADSDTDGTDGYAADADDTDNCGD